MTQPWRTPELTAKLELEFCTQQVKIVVKKRDDVDDLLRYSVLPEYFPQAGSVDAVKVYIAIPLPLIVLLQNIPKCKYVLSGSSPWSKPCLFLMRIMTTLQNTLLGIESNVTPLQLLQSARLPFLVFGQCSPCHSRGSSSFSHMSMNKGWRTSLASSGLTLRSSAGIASWPGALLFFRDLMALKFPVKLVGLPSRTDLPELVECQVQVDSENEKLRMTTIQKKRLTTYNKVNKVKVFKVLLRLIHSKVSELINSLCWLFLIPTMFLLVEW